MNQTRSSQLMALDQELRECRLCIDAGYNVAPGAIFSHPSQADVILIGQAPGITEVEARRPFNAGSGTRLFQWFEEAGWMEEEFREYNVMTAVTKCYPGKGKNGKGDRVPSRAEQRLCRPFLEREIRYYDPRLLILVGGLAIKLFYPSGMRLNQIVGTAAYFENGALEDLLNFDINQAQCINSPEEITKQNGRWIVPLPHPSGASLWPNKKENKILIQQAMKILARLRLKFG